MFPPTKVHLLLVTHKQIENIFFSFFLLFIILKINFFYIFINYKKFTSPIENNIRTDLANFSNLHFLSPRTNP